VGQENIAARRNTASDAGGALAVRLTGYILTAMSEEREGAKGRVRGLEWS
jgi:hypothetical protein